LFLYDFSHVVSIAPTRISQVYAAFAVFQPRTFLDQHSALCKLLIIVFNKYRNSESRRKFHEKFYFADVL